MLGCLNRSDEAVTAARQAIALSYTTSRHHVVASDLLLRQGKPGDALTEALIAAVVDPSSGHAHGHLGHAFEQSGDDTGAEFAYRRALELEPSNAQLFHQMSVLLARLKRLDDAIEAATEATRLEPGNPQRFAHLANLHVQRQDLSAATAAQREAVLLDPDSLRLRVYLSELYARTANYDEALMEATIAWEAHRNNAHAVGFLAHILQLRGQFDEAEAMYHRAISLDSANTHLKQELAYVQNCRSRMAAA
jgi:Flp pilus assembly protein TadD